MNLIKSTGTFSFFTIISRLLGYLRDILIAVFLGTGPFADAFFVAFRIPNTFRRLFSEGTFNAAFVPSYASELSQGKDKSDEFANNVFNLLILGLFTLVIVIEIFMPLFVFLIAPGFDGDPQRMDLAINLTRITFPFLFFISLASFFSAILNSHNRFAAASAAPIILNILLIGILFYGKILDDKLVYYLSYAVTLSGVVQLIFLHSFVKRFYLPTISFKIKINSKVKSFFKKLLPSIFSSGVTQINILVGTIIASFEVSAVSYLYYADRIYQLNLAIAGIAIGTVSLPALAKALKKRNILKVRNIQNKSMQLSLLFSLPASLGLIICSKEIVSALFGYGSFSEENVNLTSEALKYFGYGIPAFALIKVLSNFYFARDNTKIPFYLSVSVVTINVLLSLSLFKEIGFIIIPIATSIFTWCGVILYIILLYKKSFLIFDQNFMNNVLKIIFSTILMSLVLIYGLNFLEKSLEYSDKFKSIYLLFIVSFVATIYLISCYLLGILKIKSYKIN